LMFDVWSLIFQPEALILKFAFARATARQI